MADCSASDAALRVLIIGAGAVNFGGAEGPWDHSRRLERAEGVRIVGIADPDLTKARKVLERKLGTALVSEVYRQCAVYADYRDAIKSCKPHVAFIGVPPFCHGGLEPDLDIELQCLQAGIHIFVEKPVSVQPPEEFAAYVGAIRKLQEERGLVVSVGYMFRYHPAVEKIRDLLQQFGRSPLIINARYNCAYSELDHPFWWNKAKSGGPIVEQATHFCDLLRYFGGEVDLGTISSTCIDASADPGNVGYLSHIPEVVKEGTLQQSHRIPRLTSSHWKFAGGGIGTLTHGVTLHGKKYEACIDIWADGLRLCLEEPYVPECRLRVRQGPEESVIPYPDADPYNTEVEVFLAAVRTNQPHLVRSTYDDALKTYQLSWAIRRACE